MKLGIREKFLFPTMLLIFAGTSLTAGISHFNSSNTIINATIEQLQQNVGSTHEYIVSWVDNRKQDVVLWSNQSSLITAVDLAGEQEDSGSLFMMREVLDNFKTYKKAHPYFAEIALASTGGNILASTEMEKVTFEAMGRENVKDQDFFKGAAKGTVVISDVRVNKKTGTPVFVIAAPIGVKSGDRMEVTGVLFGMVDLPYFTKKFVEPVKIGEKGYVYIFNQNGVVVSHPSKDKILKLNMKNLEFGKEMIQQESGYIEYKAEGSKRMCAFKKDKDLGWTVAAVASMDEMLAPVSKLLWVNILMTLLVLVVAVVVIIWVAALVCKPIKNITESLNSVARQVSGAASQISESSQHLAHGASSQASSIEETSASLEELASMANHNADNSQQANNLSDDARGAATNGADSMHKLVHVMDGINESSQEVAKVAKGIEEIAFQTNLLALNAAVEAARAGEAGKGFAVVAEEVRNLAQRASEQARTTSSLITESRSRTEEGSKQATEADEVLRIILESVEKVGSLVGEITAASKEQAQGIDQINRAVSSMDQIVQQNSASSEESASASEELTAQAFSMKSLVRELGLLVTGKEIKDVETEAEIRAHQQLDRVQHKQDTPPPAKAKPATAALGAAPAAGAKEIKAEEIIPFDDEDMGDF